MKKRFLVSSEVTEFLGVDSSYLMVHEWQRVTKEIREQKVRSDDCVGHRMSEVFFNFLWTLFQHIHRIKFVPRLYDEVCIFKIYEKKYWVYLRAFDENSLGQI